MSKYECFAHAKTKLRYHIIFSTKYRRKCLNYIQKMRKDRYHAFRLVCEFSLYLKYIKKFLQNFKMKLI